MRSAAIILSLCLLSAAPPSESAPAPAAAAATPQVVMVSAEYADVPEFDVTGPTEVKAGASFILKADVPKGVNANAVRWVIDPAPPAFDFDRSFDGRYKLTVLDPPAGRYVTTLVGATLVDGDPVPLLTVRTVTVGDGKPDPVDPDVPPVPGPDLTGIAKVVYDAAKGIDKATLTQSAGAYGSQVSAIGAGAYNAVSLDAAKQQIVDAITSSNPPREKAPALFEAIDGQLQSLEEANKLGTLAAVSAVLSDIVTGLEAAAK